MKAAKKKPFQRSRRLTLADLAKPHEPKIPEFLKVPEASKGRAGGEHLASAYAPNPEPDLVNHPPHYKRGGIECVDVMEAMVTGWSPQTAARLGQAYQYLFRHAHKGNPVRDLEKAQWWIQREIDALKFQAANRSHDNV